MGLRLLVPLALIPTATSWAAPQSLPKNGWTIARASSEETVGENAPASAAIDGDRGTFWHSEWATKQPTAPHEIVIDLGKDQLVSGFEYLPRQVGEGGRIRDFRIYVHRDPALRGGPAAQGEFANSRQSQLVSFEATVGRYVSLVALSDHSSSGDYASVAEAGVIGEAPDSRNNHAPDGIIVSHPDSIQIPLNGSVDFKGIGSDPDGDTISTYRWSFGEGSGIPDQAVADPGPVQFRNEGIFEVEFHTTDPSGAADPTPDRVTVAVGPSLVPTNEWTVASVTSQETAKENGAATNAFDGKSGTYWHSEWSGGTVRSPQSLVIDLGSDWHLSSLDYLPRQDIPNGRISRYEISASLDNSSWGDPVASGSFDKSVSMKKVPFNRSVDARYLRVTSFEDVGGEAHAAISELRLHGVPSTEVVTTPDGTIESPSSDVTIAIGGSVDFAGSGSGGESGELGFDWSFGSGSGIANSTLASPGPVRFDRAGRFEVTLTVTDSSGAADPTPARRIVNVTDPGSPPDGTIVRPTGNISITTGDTVDFAGTASDPDEGDSLSYRWSFGEGSGIPDSSATSPGPVRFDAAGTFEVALHVTDSEGNADPSPATVSVSVSQGNRQPDGIIISPSRNVSVEVGGSVDFSATGSDPDPDETLGFRWDFGAGSGIEPATVASPGSRTFENEGTFRVVLTVTDSKGASDPTPASVTVTVGESSVPVPPRFEWDVSATSSEERVGEDGAAINALDGRASTFWHSRWHPEITPGPHHFVIDFGTTAKVSGLNYLPRQDNSNGRIAVYRISVSQDGANWGDPIANGIFPNSTELQTVTFDTVETRFLRLTSLGDVNGSDLATIAELSLISPDDEAPRPGGRLLPFDTSSPGWIDNDDTRDSYLTEYVMGLASLGELELVGLSTTSSYSDGENYNPSVTKDEVEFFGRRRAKFVADARLSGMTGIPEHAATYTGHFPEPAAQGTIEDRIDATPPLGLEASRRIVEYINDPSNGVTPERPFVLYTGGPLTVAADAYLRDPSIADRFHVAWFGGKKSSFRLYNPRADAWAAMICASRVNLTIFPDDIPNAEESCPLVPKKRIRTELPLSYLSGAMSVKSHPQFGEPYYDIDAPVAVAAGSPDYVTRIQRMRRAGTEIYEGEMIPTIEYAANGNIRMIIGVDQQAGTNEWWRVLGSPETWAGSQYLVDADSDDFDRPDSPTLGSSWQTVVGTPHAIVSGEARNTGSGSAVHTSVLGPRQFVELTYPHVANGKRQGQAVMARSANGRLEGYVFSNPGSGLCQLRAETASGTTDLLTNLPALPSGTTVGLQALCADIDGDGIDNDLRLSIYYNGRLTGSYGYIGAPFLDGSAGLASGGTASQPARYDDFTAGTVAE